MADQNGIDGPKGADASIFDPDRLADLARQAEAAFHDNVERLRTQSQAAADIAEEQLEHARTYMVERVRERPFATTVAVLGAGILIGLLLAGRRK